MPRNERSGRFSRRPVLKTIGAGVLFTGSGVVSGGENTVEIPIEKRGDDVIRWKSVPEAWWHFEKRVQNVRERISSRESNNPLVTGVGIGTEETRIAGRKVSNVIVYADKQDLDKVDLPDKVNDVKIKTEGTPHIINYSNVHRDDVLNSITGVTSLDDHWGECHDDCYNEIAGGALLENGGYERFTATTRVRHNGDDRLLTCGHPFWSPDNCNPETFGQTVYHCRDHVEAGDVAKLNRGLDYSLIKPTSGMDINGYREHVHWTDVSTRQVSGHATKEALHEFKSQDETVWKYGATTCNRDGLIKGYTEDVPWDDCVEDGVFVRTTNLAENGDSGAPIYRTWEDSEGCKWATMISLLKGSPDWTSDVWSGAAYRIAENNIEFGASWSGTCGGIS